MFHTKDKTGYTPELNKRLTFWWTMT